MFLNFLPDLSLIYTYFSYILVSYTKNTCCGDFVERLGRQRQGGRELTTLSYIADVDKKIPFPNIRIVFRTNLFLLNLCFYSNQVIPMNCTIPS